MNDIQRDDQLVGVDTDWRLLRFTKRDQAVMRKSRVAREQIGEQRNDDEANEEAKKDIVSYHPSCGGQARETFVEKHNGDLDEADSNEKNYLANGGKLVIHID